MSKNIGSSIKLIAVGVFLVCLPSFVLAADSVRFKLKLDPAVSTDSVPVSGRLLIFMTRNTKSLDMVAGTPSFKGHKEFRRYTRNLPVIDKIELLKLKLKDDRWNGEITASKVLRGTEAQKVASLWRRQTYTSSLAACHEPAYAIKFYSGKKLIAYASVCWSCNSIFFIEPNLHRTQSFAGGDKRGEQLSEIFRLAFI